MMNRQIFHIDCNNAFLSWEAVKLLLMGGDKDLRKIPSVVGGDPAKRKGIVLARSDPAKRYGIHTGMSLFEAMKKCTDLTVVSPDYDLYINCSDSLMDMLSNFSPRIERYSIDECFADMTGCTDNPVVYADKLRNDIYMNLGFTVNIGISDCKLLAKIASGFKKPDMTHTLYKNEIKDKFFPLPVSSLFMVGIKTCIKLYKLGYRKIGDVANENPEILKEHFKLFGTLIWAYANGIDKSEVSVAEEAPKGIGNSITLPEDVTDMEDGYPFLYSLCERVSMSLRNINNKCMTVSVGLKTSDFKFASHQMKMNLYSDSTKEIYTAVKKLYNELWKGIPVRQISVRLSTLTKTRDIQLDMLGNNKLTNMKLDRCIDEVRQKFGDESIIKGTLVNTGIDPVMKPVHKDYPKIKPNIFNGV